MNADLDFDVTEVLPDDARPRPSLTIREFLDEPEPAYEWKIPGLLERGDRLIVTAGEGHGKSTLLRQIGVQAGAGIHPFTLDDMPAASALIIDCENSRRHLRRQLRPLHAKVAGRLDDGRVRVCSAPAGIDLLTVQWQEWLDGRLTANQPDLLIAGPLYKLATGDPLDERQARVVARVLDEARERHACAIIIEAHTPYAAGNGKRPLRPYGASLWSRWPEFGVHLGDDGTLTHWRGARDERGWPAALQRGGDWPWTAAADLRADAEEWHGPTRCMDAVAHYFGQYPDEELSQRALGDRLRAAGNSYRESVVREAAERLAVEGRLAVRNGPRNSRLYSLPKDANELPV